MLLGISISIIQSEIGYYKLANLSFMFSLFKKMFFFSFSKWPQKVSQSIREPVCNLGLYGFIGNSSLDYYFHTIILMQQKLADNLRFRIIYLLLSFCKKGYEFWKKIVRKCTTVSEHITLIAWLI